MKPVLVEFPKVGVNDVPAALRNLADSIESGSYGHAHNLAWVVDCGDGNIECGLAGKSAAPGAEAHLLFAVAQRKLEGAA